MQSAYRACVAALVMGVMVNAAGAQSTSPEKPIPNTPGTANPGAGAPTPGKKPGVTPPQLESGKTTVTIETRLTKQQEAQLFAASEDIFKFASKDTGLPIQHPVKKVFISREQVNKELRKRFDEDKGNKRMEQSELVLKKFGLLDRDFQLRPFLLSLLTEQIAGFYDNKTKTMNLLDWVPVDEQKAVMAHELTHALQDQKVDLKHWEDTQPEGVPRTVAEDNKHIFTDEDDTARDAVLEGQAMVSFADYELMVQGSTKTLKDVPQMAQMLAGGSSDMGDSPVLARAPLVLQQSLLFPYTSGLLFEDAILTKSGTVAAFAGVLNAPPSASAQILHPAAYIAHTPMPLMTLPDIHPMLTAAGYDPYDVGVMGELDVRMTAELFGGKPLAEALAPNWDGGVYYAAQRRNAPAKGSTASLALLYESRWKNPDSAQSFFHVFEEELPRQYDGLKRRQAEETDADERVYSTNEGDVLLRREGARVWVSEGFELPLARKLRAVVDGAQGTGPVMQAGTPRHDLLGGMTAWMGSFGLMRGGLHF